MSARPPHLARPVAPSDLPTHIGKYPIKGRLGSGATSEVFLARDEFHDRLVAIKRVKVDPLADDRDQHFQNCFFAAEAALVGRLNHPNVVQIYDAVTDAEAPYLVMEYVPGNTLRRYCRAHTLLPLDQILEIGFKCANALGYCYRQGLVHRDVKPANVLVARDGRVRLLDFGIAQLVGKDDRPAALGTPRYVAPEVAMGEPSDGRADVFALGVMAFELFTGRHPWVDDDATDPKQVLMAIVASAPRPLMTTPMLPQLELGEAEVFKLSAAIGRAIYADARRRHRTADELADSFEAVLRARAP